MNKTIFCTGVFFGLLAVVLGAFGAHGLGTLVSDGEVDTFKTGVTYQMYHALFLLILGSVRSISEENKKLIYYLISSGIVLFSFSIYFLATNSLTGFDFRTIGFITPIGGILLILGWLFLGYRAYREFK